MGQDNITNLREGYYDSVCGLTEEKEILEALPTAEYSNFFPLMEGLLEKFDMDLELLAEMKDEALTDTELLAIQAEIDSLYFKKEICQKYYNDAKEVLVVDNTINIKKKRLIFATTSSGNIYLEKDLMEQSLSEEYYDRCLEALEDVSQEIDITNPKKAKTFVAHEKLSGVQEIKKFQIRLLYKHLPNDCVYLMMITKKKDTLTRNYKEMLIQRTERTAEEYKNIKNLIQNNNEDELKELFKRNEEIENRIKKYLTDNKRGVKGGK